MSHYLDTSHTIRRGEELPVERLAAYLRAHLPGVTGALEVEQFPGGHSNLTYLVRADGVEMVLRRPPFGNRVKTAHDMGREYLVLSRLHPVYPPAPRPLLYCDDEAVLGAPFYLLERRRGIIIREAAPPGLHLAPATVRAMCNAFIANLAHLHAIDFRAVGLADLGRPEGYVRRQIEGWMRRYLNVQTEDVPGIEAAMAWLAQRIPAESGAAIIHNDYKFDNIMLDAADPTRIVAVLDWEMCTLGDPLLDLGGTLAYWVEAHETELIAIRGPGVTSLPGSLTRRELAARYGELTGRDVSNMLYYYCYGLFKLAVILQQIYYRYVKGFTQDQRFAHLNQHVALLTRLASRAIETEQL